MTSSTCDSCKVELQSSGNIMLKVGDGYQHLCSSYYNEVMAEHLGISYENVHFGPDVMTDKNGTKHTFAFHSRLIGNGKVLMEGVELKEEDLTGYKFQILG